MLQRRTDLLRVWHDRLEYPDQRLREAVLEVVLIVDRQVVLEHLPQWPKADRCRKVAKVRLGAVTSRS